MPAPRLKTKLLGRREACDALSIGTATFSRHWKDVFTDPRPPEDRRRCVARRVYEDELAVAVDAGGGVSSRAKAAVLNYRGSIKRK